MSGIQEILVIALIVLAILIIPRMRSGQRVGPTATPLLSRRLSGKLRLSIAASLVYPALVAAVLQPWNADPIRFVYIGLGPVAVAWLLFWVIKGFPKR